MFYLFILVGYHLSFSFVPFGNFIFHPILNAFPIAVFQYSFSLRNAFFTFFFVWHPSLPNQMCQFAQNAFSLLICPRFMRYFPWSKNRELFKSGELCMLWHDIYMQSVWKREDHALEWLSIRLNPLMAKPNGNEYTLFSWLKGPPILLGKLFWIKKSYECAVTIHMNTRPTQRWKWWLFFINMITNQISTLKRRNLSYF